MIKPGWNVLRFVRAEQDMNKQIGHKRYDAYKFIAVNLATEDIEFVYLIPIGKKKSKLIDDLIYLNMTKAWMDVELVEKNKLLCIKSMKEVRNHQAEYDFLKQRQKGRNQ